MSDDILRNIDDTIHAKARLAIMSILLLEEAATFTRLKEALHLTDGNLGAHVRALEEAGYIEVHKEFAGRKPRTTCQVTVAGRRAFRLYMEALQRLFEAARTEDSPHQE